MGSVAIGGHKLVDTFYVPVWVILSTHAAIELGNYFGGWKVVQTMGMKLSHLCLIGGFCEETGKHVHAFGNCNGGDTCEYNTHHCGLQS